MKYHRIKKCAPIEFVEAANIDEEVGVKLEIKEEVIHEEDPLSIHEADNVEEPEAQYEEKAEENVSRHIVLQNLNEHRQTTIYIAQHNINIRI